MSKLPFNPTGDASDQSWKKGKDMPEQNETAHPDDYERPEVDPTSGRRGSKD